MADRFYSGATPAQVAEAIAPLVAFERKGMALPRLRALIEERLVPHLLRYERPEFQSMFNAVPEEGAALGAEVALAFNQGVTNWQVSPGGAVMEEACCQALCNLFELGPESAATFMYSGTYANQQALYLALHRLAERQGFDLAHRGLAGFGDPSRLVVLASQGAHFSILHALRILGLGQDSLVQVDLDEHTRMDASHVSRLLRALEGGPREVVCVVATMGATTTGAVDPLLPLTESCRERGIWLHADGAYGLAYALLPEKAELFSGLAEADSITWDPHKQMGVPIPSSVLFLRRATDFDRMSIHSDYFNREASGEPNPGLKSPPSTRPLSALPLAASIRRQGLDGVRDRLRAPVGAIAALADRLAQDPEIEVVHRPDTGVLCFRVTPPGVSRSDLDPLQERVHRAIAEAGARSISVSRVNGERTLRVVAVSPAVTLEALLETVVDVKRVARRLGT